MHFPITSPIQLVKFGYDRKANAINCPLFINFFRLNFKNLIFLVFQNFEIMSKFSLPTFLFVSLIFISFTINPGQGVTRLGKFTYKVSSTARIQESEKKEIISILKATYGINDVNNARELTLKAVPLNGKKGKNPNWVVDKKAFITAIDEKAIHYNNEPTPPTDPKEPESPTTTNASFVRLNTILAKYGDMN